MSCYDNCGYDEVTRERVSELEARERLYVQTVNGVYGPFVTLEIPDVTFLTDQVEQNKDDIVTLNTELDTTNDNIAGLTYVKEILKYEASPTTFKACVKMRDDTVVKMVLPPVSELDIGLMTPSAYAQVWVNKAQIEQMLLGTSIPTGDLETATPTQVQLTTLWTTTMTRDPADGDRVMNTFDNVVWMFATELWHAISGSSTPQATNSTLGTVMGSTANGKAQVELDGTLSVNGWDATQEDILSRIPKTDIVTSIGATPSDIKVPSEKASKDYVDNEITGKLDKVTTAQTVKKVYTVGTDGENGLDDYEYIGYEYPVPVITTGSTGVTQRTSFTTATIPSNGIVSNGNFSSTYSIGTTSATGYGGNATHTIPYTHVNGNCTVTYITSGGSLYCLQGVNGSVTNNVLTFTGYTIGYGTLYVVGIGF